MQQTIKTCRYVVGLLCLGIVLNIAGCKGCNDNKNNATGPDSSVKKDTVSTMKKDSDSTSSKKSLVDTTANPPSHTPKKDTTVKDRPLGRKT